MADALAANAGDDGVAGDEVVDFGASGGEGRFAGRSEDGEGGGDGVGSD